VARPLQLELYEQYDAGEVFFENLDEMLAQPMAHAEVLEVYYLCMTLGFKGRYQLHDQERLRVLIEETFAALTRTPGMASGMLSPHGKPRDQAATEVRSKLPVWVIAVFAVTLGLIIYVGMSLYMNSAANNAAQSIEQIPSGSVQ
jgi:type VI secretion system protein ImpK